MEPRVLQLLLVLHVLALPVQLCGPTRLQQRRIQQLKSTVTVTFNQGVNYLAICAAASDTQPGEIPEGKSSQIRCLNTELLRLSQDPSVELNPSVYVALRLSADHSLEKEAQYLRRLKDVVLPSVSSSVAVGLQKQLSTGRLALYLLALRAACQDMETLPGRQLVTQLKYHLHREKEQIASKRKGRPITSYYQYSLGILALCVHGKQVETHVIQKLLNAEKHNNFTHGGEPSVDTEAMAGLAFTCLGQAKFYEAKIAAEIRTAGQRVTEKILQAQTATGTLGNVFSSPLAVQLLIATGMSKKPECPKVMAALLGSLERGHFQNPMTMSQLLPVLYGKSYLDITTMACQAEKDTLDLDTTGSGPPIPGTEKITVQLVVERSLSPKKLYNHSIEVPSGSSLLDVLRTAEQCSPGQFTFETQSTLQGLFLTSAMGVKAGDGDRQYWQLLRAPDTSLEKGVSDYQPQDGETILLKFRPW